MADRRAFLSVSAAAAVAAPLIGGAEASASPRSRPRPQAPDAALRQILRDIDPRRIERIVRRLAGFGTRHTLSAQDDPVRGIGAARDWIHAQLSRYAAASGGRMTVELQSYVQQPATR